jgi:hypothetical protein
MGNCKECAHWGEPAKSVLPGGTTVTHRATFYRDDVKQCERLQVLEQDGEPCGGNAYLGTPADFGCVLFEAKEVA